MRRSERVRRRQEQDHEALVQLAKSLKTELENLQIVYERLNAECVDCLSPSELESLGTQLSQGLLKVKDQLAKKTKDQELAEKFHIQREAKDEETGRLWVARMREVNLAAHLGMSKLRRISRHKARELRNSSEERQQEQDQEALLRSTETMKTDIKALQLLVNNTRGEELDRLNYYELTVLQREIFYSFFYISSKDLKMKTGERKGSQEQGSGNVADDCCFHQGSGNVADDCCFQQGCFQQGSGNVTDDCCFQQGSGNVTDDQVQLAKSLKTELENLQIVYERLNGECVDCLSPSELESLGIQLRQGLLKVKDQLVKKTKDQELAEKFHIEREAKDEETGRRWVARMREVNLAAHLGISKLRRIARHKARELRSRQQEQDHEALVRCTETMKTEIKALQLLVDNTRGEELDRLNYYELTVLQREIFYSLFYIDSKDLKMKTGKRKRSQEQGSDNVTVNAN